MRPISLLAAIIAAWVLTLLAPEASGASRGDTISARRAFVELPATTLDLLPHDTRLDMLDYFDVDSIYRAPNTMDGRSWLETVTPNYVKLVMTSVST
ncbi:MAG: DUF3256 family protein, partial [Muribaculaceae bacterium]|nr:DUF3256 family protein [Muribaculaceae bacterium]